MKAHVSLSAASIFAVVLILSGGAYAADAVKPEMAAPMASPKPAAEPNLANVKPDEVMARYGDQKLTLKEIEYFIPSPTPQSAGQLANQWLELQMMYEAAQKRDITNDPKAKLMAQLNSESVFANTLMNKIASEVNIPDANVREYYDKNKDTDPQLSEPVRLSFTHIKVKTADEANAVKKRIEAGEDITALAKELSTAADAKNGGSVKKAPLMMIERQYGKEFADALLAASEGKIVGPIKAGDGFEVARHEGKLSQKAKPFADVAPIIKRNLEQKAKMEASEHFKASLKKDSASKSYISPLLAMPAAKPMEKKSSRKMNLPIDNKKTSADNAMKK